MSTNKELKIKFRNKNLNIFKVHTVIYIHIFLKLDIICVSQTIFFDLKPNRLFLILTRNYALTNWNYHFQREFQTLPLDLSWP